MKGGSTNRRKAGREEALGLNPGELLKRKAQKWESPRERKAQRLLLKSAGGPLSIHVHPEGGKKEIRGKEDANGKGRKALFEF